MRIGLLLTLVLAACAATPQRDVTPGEPLAVFDFSSGSAFEIGQYANEATLRAVNGVYQINIRTGDNEIWWGQGGDAYSDVIVEVETEQISLRPDNAYGVMCRVSGDVLTAADIAATAEPAPPGVPNGNGYLFLIQGGGAYAIMVARERNLTPLVNWQASDAINRGPSRNTLRAVCVDDYLAFYINDQFVADTTDTTYSSGQVGLAASAANRLGVTIHFDNLTIYEVAAGS